MATLTRGNLIDRCAAILGDTSTDFRTYLETSFNHVLFMFFDIHDWNFKHKSGTFSTVAGTESYNLATSSADIRSSQDVEVLYDTTNGRFIDKVDLRDIRKRWPKEDTSGKPKLYAPWGSKTIVLSDEPDAIYVMKYLYLAKATASTSDSDDLESTLGIPDYVQYVVEKMLLSEGMLKYDDNRRSALLAEIGSPFIRNSLLFNAVQADMKHLESGARFKFWEEELASNGGTFNDFLRATWANAG